VRGRLINPFVIELQQLDTAATSQVVGGGYDADFGEPRPVPNGTPGGGDSRRETELRVHAQIEPQMFNAARTLQTGLVREARFVCVVHFQELEARDLIGADGQPRIRVNDRLAAIYQADGTLVMQIPPKPGLYIHQTLPVGFGLGGKRNLLQLEFRSREQAR